MLPPTVAAVDVRPAGPDDIDGVAALLADRADASDGVDVRLVAADPEVGPAAVGVAVDGGRVVGTLTLLDEVVEVVAPGDGGSGVAVALPAAQIEHVAVARTHEGRGLARALMAWAHQQSAARGHLVQVIPGIPGLYRHFGYVDGLRAAPVVALRSDWHPSAAAREAVAVRPATPADGAALAALHRAGQSAADVRLAHPPARWRWLLNRTGTVQLVAVDADGQVVGTARSTPPEDSVVTIGEVVATTTAAAEALLGFAVTAADGTSAVRASALPAAPAATVVAGAGVPFPTRWLDVRVPDPAALVARLRPVLEARRAASPFAGGDLDVAALVTSTVPPDALARALFANGAAEPADDRLATLLPPVTSSITLLCLT